jgi:bifunctional non-homologous end joining protein LigD
MSCRVEQQTRVQLVSRHGRDWSTSFPTILEAARALPCEAALLDGELVVLLPNGLTSFQALQNRHSLPPGARLTYLAFDLLHLDGDNTARRPLAERKAKLEALLKNVSTAGVIRYLPHIVGDAPRVLKRACALGAEGIVVKRRDAAHVAGRSRGWLKCKCHKSEPFVIGGYTGHATSAGLSALLLGYYDEHGGLHYAGNVGTGKGFTREFLRELRTQLAGIAQESSPFAGFARASLRSAWGKGRPLPTYWVRPLVVVTVAFTEWTSDGQLRHPSFHGFRADLAAKLVVRTPHVRRDDE